jgi:hypothetical protein
MEFFISQFLQVVNPIQNGFVLLGVFDHFYLNVLERIPVDDSSKSSRPHNGDRFDLARGTIKLQLDSGLPRGISVQLPNYMANPGERGEIRKAQRRK